MHQALCQILPQCFKYSIDDYAGFRNLIAELAAQEYRFVLIVDEFELMAGNPNFDTDFFKHLRALGNNKDYRFAYLLASRRPLQKLCEVDRIEHSSFWNIFGITFTLGLLQAGEADWLLKEPWLRTMAKGSMVDLDIKQRTGHHPAMIQMVINIHW